MSKRQSLGEFLRGEFDACFDRTGKYDSIPMTDKALRAAWKAATLEDVVWVLTYLCDNEVCERAESVGRLLCIERGISLRCTCGNPTCDIEVRMPNADVLREILPVPTVADLRAAAKNHRECGSKYPWVGV